MDIYWTVFWVLVFGCFLLYLYTRQAVEASEDISFSKFQRAYLLVYLLAMGRYCMVNLGKFISAVRKNVCSCDSAIFSVLSFFDFWGPT